jgi:PIN domain nuclease of toxin-antitoxin system
MKSKGETAGGLLLDTHIWLWFAEGGRKLEIDISQKITKAGSLGQLYLSAISLWELAMMFGKGRLTLHMPFREWLQELIAKTSVTILPVDVDAAAETAALPESFHGDPSDRLIAATARVHNLSLMTRDKLILRHGESGFLKCIAA